MSDKENAAPPVAAAVGPRVTRAAAKRAAAEAATAGGGKRKRVALGELPAVTNAPAAARPSRSPSPRPEARNSRPSSPPPPPFPLPLPRRAPRWAPTTTAPRPPRPRRARRRPPPSRRTPPPPPRPPPRCALAEVADPCATATSPLPSRPAAADAQLCPAYASDIYSYLRALEAQPHRRPRADYIEALQKDVSANMRAILVDWLVEVAEEYKLLADTLYLAIYYIDRFLSVNALGRDKLQLLGVAAMLIAAKYEEISPPHVEDFCYITDNTYTKQELLEMEGDILKLMKFELGNPTIKTFLRRFTRAVHDDKKRSMLLFEFLGSYLAELSLLDYGCLQYLPSLVAASVVFVANLTIDPHTNPWNYKLQKMTGYKVSELKDCIIAIHSLQLNKKCSSSTAIRDKYKQHKFKCVSSLLPSVVIPTSYLEDVAE
ncbi:hypothetical protein PR202_ga12050 [Eleusine coracana subsp. coracana]|uniref:Cyclin N-terminal domain-containing protein n=1 Tax=Eleusine coracana subsp. coracana TaxID=191504 RepID=A0AAV5CB54_ELECO|nr:hypothetical protein PR202_ga12050 [Eleusine coracana subsp. coracana]